MLNSGEWGSLPENFRRGFNAIAYLTKWETLCF